MKSSPEDSCESGPAPALTPMVAMALFDADPERRSQGLAMLKSLYVKCDCGACTTDPEVARAALPYAKQALNDPDPEIRITGARAVELFATDSGEAIPDLARVLVDPSLPVRLSVLEALCEGVEGASALAAQIADRLVHAPTVKERSLAAVVLGNIGAEADYLKALLHALLNDAAIVQASVAGALMLGLDGPSDERRERISNALHRLAHAGGR